MNQPFYYYDKSRPGGDELSESIISEDISLNAARPFPEGYHNVPYTNDYMNENESLSFERNDSYSNPAHRIQPRPLNPELDIQINPDSIRAPPLISIPNPYAQPVPSPAAPQNENRPNHRVWKESDFQLAVVPSSDSSELSFGHSSKEDQLNIEDSKSDDLNQFLEDCGLPTMDFTKMTTANKDELYQHTIREIASAYARREGIIKQLAKKALLTDDDKPALDLLREVNENVDKIITENHLIARTSIVENVQHIGRRLKKAEKKGAILNNVLDLIENDQSSTEDLQTMDKEFDNRVEQNMKRVVHMKKYRSRYKSLLYVKYKVVDMINRMTESNLDQLIDTDKLIPILDANKFSLSRVKAILNSKSYTPEWKVRELREVFGV